MAIGNVIERGQLIYVYDEKGRQLFTKSGGSGPNDGLQGYISSTVNIRIGSLVYTYDERGRQVAATSAR
jgi:hypothetical protein